MAYKRAKRLLIDSIQITYIGLGIFATTFMISLWNGTAAMHPVLGPLTDLYVYGGTIVMLAITLALAKELKIQADQPRESHPDLRSKIRLSRPLQSMRQVSKRQLLKQSAPVQ